MLKINMEYRKGVLFVRLKGDLTKYTVNSLNNYLIPVITKNGIRYVVYNLGAVRIIDNYGKASLEKGVEATRLNDGETILCNTNLNFNNEFKIVADELSALSLLEV